MRLGPYRIVGEVGRGGMGVVYRGVGPDGRAVAIKVLGQRHGAGALARFDRERRLLGRLSESDGFIPLLDAGMSEHGPYIAMPFVAGGTLASRMAGGKMAVGAVVALGAHLAAALGRAHALGIVHRDVKPENVLFAPDGSPLIADLGLGKHFRETGSSTWGNALSRTGAFRGTFGYVSPEQARDAKTVGPPSDVWSLGAMLHECLTGRPLFDATSPVEYIVRATSSRAPSVREAREDVPPWLDRVIARALHPDPRRRYRDGAELLAALQAGESVEDRPAGRLAGALAGGGAVGLVLAALTVWLFAVDSRPPVPPAPVPPTPAPVSPPDPVPGPVDVPEPVAEAPAPDRTERASYAALAGARTRLTAIWGETAGKHGSLVTHVAFSPDGARVVTGSLLGDAAVWDVASGGALVRVVPGSGEQAGLRSTALTPDGTRLLTGTAGRELVVWDVATGRELKRWRTGQHDVYSLVVMPDCERVFSGSTDGSIRLLEIASERSLLAIDLEDDQVRALALSADATILAVVTFNGEIRRHRVADGELISSCRTERRGEQWISLATDARRALLAGPGETAEVWDLEQGRIVGRLGGHPNGMRGVAISGDGERGLTAGNDGVIRYWDLERFAPIRALRGHLSWVHDVALSPDGRLAASAGNDQTVRLWDLQTGEEIAPGAGHRGRATGVCFTADGEQVVSGGIDGTLRTWRAADGEPLTVRDGHGAWVVDVAVSADGRDAVTLGPERDGARLIHWDQVTGRSRQVVGVSGQARRVAISPDGRYVAVTTDPVSVIDLVGGRQRVVDVENEGAPSDVAFLDGSRLLIAGLGGWVAELDLAGGRVQRRQLDRDAIAFGSIAVSRARRRVILGGARGGVFVGDLGTGRIERAAGHPGPVIAVGISEDGDRGVSIGFQRGIRIWDLSGPAPVEIDRLALPADLADYANDVAMAPDGRSFVVACARGVILRFEIDGD